MDFAFLLTFLVIYFCAIWLFIFLAIYFTPVIIAYIRKHNNIFAILILTIFLGWTFFGWFAAVLWSLNCDIKDNDD